MNKPFPEDLIHGLDISTRDGDGFVNRIILFHQPSYVKLDKPTALLFSTLHGDKWSTLHYIWLLCMQNLLAGR